MSFKKTLQEALKRQAAGVTEVEEAAPPSPPPPPSPVEKAPRMRAPLQPDTVMLCTRVPIGVRQSLRLILAMQPKRNVESLVTEALDDLFAKHGVPQTARSRG